MHLVTGPYLYTRAPEGSARPPRAMGMYYRVVRPYGTSQDTGAGVRRHEGRRGRPLDVLVEWEGEDSDGDLWEESWVSVTELTADLRAEARQLEMELFGPRPGKTASHRVDGAAARERKGRAAVARPFER